MARPTLTRIIAILQKRYGRPKPPPGDPWRLILRENVAYLADDSRREAAFRKLRSTVGTDPQEILKASERDLLAVTRHGILPGQFAEKLRDCARLAARTFGGDLAPVLRQPPAEAIRILRRFPGIGEPGAEKILLFAGALPVLALDSNGLRALVRVGFGRESSSYSATYRSVRKAVAPQASGNCRSLAEAHLLLRRHGQELCKRSSPLCSECPLARRCAFARSHSGT